MHVPEQFCESYLKLLLLNHEAGSQDKFDLGHTNTLMHEISLKMAEPINIKQFRIPEAHRKEVKHHVME
jgi:hypothetical protein